MSVLALNGPVVPASAGFKVSFIDPDGGRRCEPLSSCWTVPFERALPVRAFTSYKGQKSFSGLWWFSTTSERVGYESWLERDRVMALDFDPDVIGLSSQPFKLLWEQNGEDRSHTPDFFARLRDGTGVVINVRSGDQAKPEDAGTGGACESVGWGFR